MFQGITRVLFHYSYGMCYASCCVNESRRYSRDLPQGGLEIPCINTYENE